MTYLATYYLILTFRAENAEEATRVKDRVEQSLEQSDDAQNHAAELAIGILDPRFIA